MSNANIQVDRTGPVLQPDQSRVLLRPFNPGSLRRAGNIIDRVMAVPEDQVVALLEKVTDDLSQRHSNVQRKFSQRFEQVRDNHVTGDDLSEQRRLLIGAYFLAEYSLESAALFNPSIVPHIDQSNLPSGALRFILSLRATGEGHVSSITFRTGIVHSDNRIEVEDPHGFLTEPQRTPNQAYEKDLFSQALHDLGMRCEFTGRVINRLNDTFSMAELRHHVDKEVEAERRSTGLLKDDHLTANGILLLAQSNYEVQFEPEQEISQRILFPATLTQSNGIEDARFVRFRNDNGSHVYYATFTAFDGKVIVPELVVTADFLRFRFITLNGPAAQNKGMAMFPRKIDGKYAMLARQDNESIYLSFSDNIHFWHDHKVLLEPIFPWELIQIGNCGSPIETDAGWLVLSHGVGPMRTYCIGAFLLDRDDPSQVIGRMSVPLLQPNQKERRGYVPNVVYTCGALLHQGQLIIPYGLADHATGFATVPVDQVLAAMKSIDP